MTIKPAHNPRSNILAQGAFELFVALLAVLSCVIFFVKPSLYASSAVAQFAPWDFAWNTMYGVGGVLVIVGLVRLSPRLEVAGLCLFCSAVSINAVLVLSVYGGAAWPTIPTFVGFAAASLVRIAYLVHLSRLYSASDG